MDRHRHPEYPSHQVCRSSYPPGSVLGQQAAPWGEGASGGPLGEVLRVSVGLLCSTRAERKEQNGSGTLLQQQVLKVDEVGGRAACCVAQMFVSSYRW